MQSFGKSGPAVSDGVRSNIGDIDQGMDSSGSMKQMRLSLFIVQASM